MSCRFHAVVLIALLPCAVPNPTASQKLAFDPTSGFSPIDENGSRTADSSTHRVSSAARAFEPGPDLDLHPTFSNGMVLQRERPIRLFGSARPRTDIRVRFDDETATTTADDTGRWKLDLRPRQASSTPQALTVHAAHGRRTVTRVIEDVLIGEVWVCSGQSNMRWRVIQSRAAADAASNDDPHLRLIDFEGRVSPTRKVYPLALLTDVNARNYYTTAGWRSATRESISPFSAVAYFFGRKLREEIRVPVGLIHDAIGGVPTEAYIPRAAMAKDAALASSLRDWLNNEAIPAWCRQRGRLNLETWFATRAGALPHHPFEPGFLAAASTERIAGYGIRGFIWYQGESNATEGGTGTPARKAAPEKHKLATLIKSWRRLWQDDELAFYFVQLPGLNRDWSAFREMQLQVESELPGVGMAVITDLGHPSDVHPRKKKPVGERLARLALARTYGQDLLPTGPRARQFLIEPDQIRVTFNHGAGLNARGHDGAVRGLAIAGADHVFHPATGAIDGQELIVSSPIVNKPMAVRYAWSNDPGSANLVNGDDLPASPFRSDDWPTGPPPPLPIADDLLSFEEIKTGALTRATSKGWRLRAERGHAEITGKFAHSGKQSLHIRGGGWRTLTMSLPQAPDGDRTLAMRAERWTARGPFSFRIESSTGGAWREAFNGDAVVAVGARFLTDVRCVLPKGTRRIRMRCQAPEGGGILIDDVQILPADAMPPPPVIHQGVVVRAPGQDGVHTYRIPGLVTTKKGTLIAVYDIRRSSSGDLPGNIDVGMSRSTDGGRTWSPMKVIMDMGSDPGWRHDGIGDPAVLVDRVTGAIWVAATWSHGNRSWNGSGPGLKPADTGQFMLTRSTNDGRTWSKPINITRQIKDPAWRFVLQGPGKGITMRNGTLVFPAQFRSSDQSEHRGKPFSTLISSTDRGKTWKIGTGVKVDTTESQVVELADGRLMINCRDNRGGSRSVYTTDDLGKTWTVHPTSRKALPEPVCMASLIRVDHETFGPLLIFSNPATTRGRHHMTIKVSRDEGMTWPARYHTLYDERPGFGYSCLTRIDADHVGVLYEGTRSLRFVRFSIADLLRAR